MDIDNQKLPLFIGIEPSFTKLYRHYMENKPPRNGSSFYEAFYKGYDGILFKKTRYVRFSFAHVAWRAGRDFKQGESYE